MLETVLQDQNGRTAFNIERLPSWNQNARLFNDPGLETRTSSRVFGINQSKVKFLLYLDFNWFFNSNNNFRLTYALSTLFSSRPRKERSF